MNSLIDKDVDVNVRYQAFCFAHWLRSEKGRQTISSLQKKRRVTVFLSSKTNRKNATMTH